MKKLKKGIGTGHVLAKAIFQSKKEELAIQQTLPFLLLGKSRTLEGIDRILQIHNLDCRGLNFQGEGWYKGDNECFLLVFENDHWSLFQSE